MDPVKKISAILKTGFCTLLPSCRDASRLQSEALDKELSFPRRFGLALHLMVCKWCRRYGRQVRFLRDAAHEHPEEMVTPLPHKMSDEARERIKRRLQAEEE